MEPARDWTKDYYDAMYHYAWSPGDLDHISIPKRELIAERKSPKETLERLRRIEVPFNHILAFFFSLAPSSVVTELFANHASVEDWSDVRFRGRLELEQVLHINAVTQPDFVFEGSRAFLMIEVKTESRSSAEQLVKYAYLHALADQNKAERAHGLLFLTPYPQEKLFGRKFANWEAAKCWAIEEFEKSQHKPWIKKKVAESKAREILSTPGKLRIGHCSFSDFAEVLRALSEQTAFDSVESRLYQGMLAELERRMKQLGIAAAA